MDDGHKMSKLRVGLVTAWAECGMGYLAKNWVHTFDKNLDKIDYQIYSRAVEAFTPFRWKGSNVIDGPATMEIGHDHFWKWVESFKPDVILFQDQNLYGPSNMQEETAKLRKMGIRLINYPDWVKWGDVEQYKGLYDANLAHIKRNHQWLIDDAVESPTYIPWGVILDNFPFVERNPKDKVTFYINLGTGTLRKGYPIIPKALKRMEGNLLQRIVAPKKYDYNFIATAVENSAHRVKKKFVEQFGANPNCELRFQTADNSEGGLFSLGDVYIYPTTKEGVGLTITEALCTGMPVVTTDFPTMNEWFEDGYAGRHIKTSRVKRSSMPTKKAYASIPHLAKIMEEYIKHPELVREQSLNARKLVEEQYNWDDRDELMMKLLRG